MRIMKYSLVILFAITLWGCGKGNSAAPVTIDPVTNNHPSVAGVSWASPSAHGAITGQGAKAAVSSGGGMISCSACHGSDFTGGISKQSCINNGVGCHGGVLSPHPKPWIVGTFAHTNTDPSNAAACAICHLGGANFLPQVNPVPAGAVPGCMNNTLCHGQAGHSFPFPGSMHKPTGTGTLVADAKAPYTNCSGCHDTTTPGGTYPVAPGTKPLCSGCHINFANFTGPTPGCWDCHGASSTDGRPNGSVYPNIQNAHDVHNFAGVTCDACHHNAGSGASTHGNSGGTANKPATVSISPTFQANNSGTLSPAAAYDSTLKTCSNISCHGGITTLQTWDTQVGGAYDPVAGNCTNCHTVGTALNAPQFNSPYSGTFLDSFTADVARYGNLHNFHMNPLFGGLNDCTQCHDPAALTAASSHFRTLNTTPMEGPASATIYSTFSYNSGTSWTCTNTSCHSSIIHRWK